MKAAGIVFGLLLVLTVASGALAAEVTFSFSGDFGSSYRLTGDFTGTLTIETSRIPSGVDHGDYTGYLATSFADRFLSWTLENDDLPSSPASSNDSLLVQDFVEVWDGTRGADADDYVEYYVDRSAGTDALLKTGFWLLFRGDDLFTGETLPLDLPTSGWDEARIIYIFREQVGSDVEIHTVYGDVESLTVSVVPLPAAGIGLIVLGGLFVVRRVRRLKR